MKKILFLSLILGALFFSCNTSKKAKTKEIPVNQIKLPPDNVLVSAQVINLADDFATLKIQEIKQRSQGFVAPLQKDMEIKAKIANDNIKLVKGQETTLRLKAQEQMGGNFSYEILEINKTTDK